MINVADFANDFLEDLGRHHRFVFRSRSSYDQFTFSKDHSSGFWFTNAYNDSGKPLRVVLCIAACNCNILQIELSFEVCSCYNVLDHWGF